MLLYYEEFKKIVLGSAQRQLGVAIDPAQFNMRKVEWDPARFMLAIEFYNAATVPLRFRVYISNILGINLTSFRLFEDPNFGPGPMDEVYVSEAGITTEVYYDLLAYFRSAIEDDDYMFYSIILDTDNKPIVSTDSFYIFY